MAVAPVKTTMELLALVLEAKAQVPEEPVKVQEVDWMMVGVFKVKSWNLTLKGLAEPAVHSKVTALPMIW